MSAPPPVTAPPAQRRGLGTALGAAALAVATAALVVAGMSFMRQPAKEADAAGASTAASGSATDTSAADKALCEAVAPALAEGDRVSNAYTDLGDAGNPARDAATPKFVDDTINWIQKAQGVLDAHTDASGFLRRTLQQFLDDSSLLAIGTRPGTLPKYQETRWESMMSSYNGPLSTCKKLGVKW